MTNALEASRWAHKSVQRKPNYRIGHAYLAASLAQANRLEEARESVNNYLESFPNETISNIRESSGPGITHRFEEGLRKAGLPE